MKEELFFSETESYIFIKAVGHITARLCPDLKNKIITLCEKADKLTDLFVDLSACEYMDSTFMGLLIGLHKKLSRDYSIKLTLLAPSESCLSLLKGLGLDRLLSISDEISIVPDNLEPLYGSVSVSTQLLLKAHENLMEVSEQNKKKFNLLHSILKERMREEEK